MPKLNTKRFRELRDERSWTLADVARAAKIGFGTPSRWEHGLSNPGDRSLANLAEVFGVEVEELIAKDEES
jgi:transcriptional regulator with XRE-family HTH domain